MIHNKVRDALIEFDENTLPPALQAGDSLLHIRGGLPSKYSVLLPFRRVRVTRIRDLKESALPRMNTNAFSDPNQGEKIKLLSDLLARLERMVDAKEPNK